ncbi:hypothetical protein DFH09DRAFT_1280161 [Mycena vulgaris]|nr:hypothetical protein DFH09DRAFT_1280161 [Mycena vulgaris]
MFTKFISSAIVFLALAQGAISAPQEPRQLTCEHSGTSCRHSPLLTAPPSVGGSGPLAHQICCPGDPTPFLVFAEIVRSLDNQFCSLPPDPYYVNQDLIAETTG